MGLGDGRLPMQHHHVRRTRRLRGKPDTSQRQRQHLLQAGDARIANPVASQDKRIATGDMQGSVEDDGQGRADDASCRHQRRIHDLQRDGVVAISDGMQRDVKALRRQALVGQAMLTADACRSLGDGLCGGRLGHDGEEECVALQLPLWGVDAIRPEACLDSLGF
jgi:hypothetical protein